MCVPEAKVGLGPWLPVPIRREVLEGQDTLPRALSQGVHLSHVRDSPATGLVPPFSLSLGALSTRACLRGW